MTSGKKPLSEPMIFFPNGAIDTKSSPAQIMALFQTGVKSSYGSLKAKFSGAYLSYSTQT